MSYEHPYRTYPVQQPPYQGGQPESPYHQYAMYPAGGYQEGELGAYWLESWFNFRNTGYLKGFVIGAGLALVLTNTTVQKTLATGAVRLWTAVQGGVEEVKEHVQDIKAEMSGQE